MRRQMAKWRMPVGSELGEEKVEDAEAMIKTLCASLERLESDCVRLEEDVASDKANRAATRRRLREMASKAKDSLTAARLRRLLLDGLKTKEDEKMLFECGASPTRNN